MAKKQTRRGISVNRLLYEHAKKVAAERMVPLSALTEHCLAVETGYNLSEVEKWRAERKHDTASVRAAPRPSVRADGTFTWRGTLRAPLETQEAWEERMKRIDDARQDLARRYQEVAATYAAGSAVGPTAAKHNVTIGFVRRALKFTGTPSRPVGRQPGVPGAKISQRQLDIIAHIQRPEVFTYRDIAKIFKVSHQRVQQIAKKFGVTRKAT